MGRVLPLRNWAFAATGSGRRPARGPVHGLRQPVELAAVQLVEDPGERVALEDLDVGQRRSTTIAQCDVDDAPVLVVAEPMDEAALLHPIDEPRRVRERHVQRVRDAAHRHRPVSLEHRHDVEVRHADAHAEKTLAAETLHLAQHEPELGDHLPGHVGPGLFRSRRLNS
jgi:hypothetical protein